MIKWFLIGSTWRDFTEDFLVNSADLFVASTFFLLGGVVHPASLIRFFTSPSISVT